MATAAARTRKRELGPDWRDALRASVKRLALRTWGALLLGLAIAGALALATHSPTDPSFSTAAGGPPTNWLGSFGAYASDALLLLFGMGSVLFLPVIALAGPADDAARADRAGSAARLLVAGVGAVLIGIALSLTSGSAVSGLPGGWGGALGLAAAYGVDAAIGLIRNPRSPGRSGSSLLLCSRSPACCSAIWRSACRRPRRPGCPATVPARAAAEGRRAAPDRSKSPRTASARRAAAVAPGGRGRRSPPRPIAAAQAARPQAAQPRVAAKPGARRQLPAAGARPARRRAGEGRTQIDRAGLERNARLLESVLEDFHVRGDIVEVRPARSSPCTSSSRPAASRPAG